MACLALTAALAGCGSGAKGSGVASAAGDERLTVVGATVDLPANPEVAAVRMVVHNGRGQADALVGVSSPVARDAMVHRSITDSAGRASMVMVAQLPIAARSDVTFEPGGLHVMLTGITRPLEVGDQVSLTLEFRDAGTIRTRAVVVRPGSSAGASHEH